MAGRPVFSIADHSVAAGKRAQFELPIARLMSGTPVALPVQVLHGADEGPSMFLTGAIHGDELCGVEIIRQVVGALDPRTMRGTVIACPIVNVHGFNFGERYLPDRRDLNRSFPGSPRGSLASRLAHLLMTEVVGRCDVGLDFHTGADHRSNYPHIRADLDDPRTMELTEAFGPAIAVDSKLRDGSIRQAATERGVTVLLFEGGEPLRFDTDAVTAGRDGAFRVLDALGIADVETVAPGPMLTSRRTGWVRAQRSGVLHPQIGLGSEVAAGESVALIYDAFGRRLSTMKARTAGVVIGLRQHPLVNQGDAVAHVAEV